MGIIIYKREAAIVAASLSFMGVQGSYMEKKIRITGKLLLIMVGTICLIYLIHKDETVFQLKQPEGEGILIEDVQILLEALNPEDKGAIEELCLNEKKQYLNYGSYLALLEKFGLTEEEELLYKMKYRDSFYLLKEDWYRAYDRMIAALGMEDVITCREIPVLTNYAVLEGEKVGENCLVTAAGEVYQYCSEQFAENDFRLVIAYVREDMLLTVKETTRETFLLKNAWLMETDQEKLLVFWGGFEIPCPYPNTDEEEIIRESVADITFGAGKVQSVVCKQDRISGRLLRVSDEELEIEGKGIYPVEESCKIYRLYGALQEQKLSDVQLGYDFADYVIDDGKICGVLILRKENMESIRVAIRSNQFASLYHEEIKIQSDCDAELVYGFYGERKTKLVKAGEELCFDRESEYLYGDIVLVKPLVLSAKTQVLSLERNQGLPTYRGSFWIANTKEGMTLVNEVLLEDYLYSVVPSEMPASYPDEALKAQAICARTYAYQYLENPGLGRIGAHVDDSVAYQVYNNIAENGASTKAVKETTGQLLFFGEEPVNTYYYSTSCGYGTDAGVWQEENVTRYPYLSSVAISRMNGDAKLMQQEETIREYLKTVHKEDYECKEAWYRWQYKVEELYASVLYERLYSRFHADNSKILKLTENNKGENDGVYESVEPTSFSEIYDIKCIKRRDGGVMDELLIDTDSGTYKVISEYNIRYILNQGGEITRQDKSTASCGQLLPSAYIVIEEKKEHNEIKGYEILGGGYGHGVGMSQNGAKNMAYEGMDSSEIIAFFYPDCELRQVY